MFISYTLRNQIQYTQCLVDSIRDYHMLGTSTFLFSVLYMERKCNNYFCKVYLITSIWEKICIIKLFTNDANQNVLDVGLCTGRCSIYKTKAWRTVDILAPPATSYKPQCCSCKRRILWMLSQQLQNSASSHCVIEIAIQY